MSRPLSIVMYHYVRDLEASAYPQIRGLRTSEFRYQLDYLKREYTPVSMPEVVHSIRTGDALPQNAVLLTFDDGYKEHYDEVVPIMVDAGVKGAFFPPSKPILNSQLLDVNRIHFILAATSTEQLSDEIETAVRENRDEYQLSDFNDYRTKWAVANRVNDANMMFVKRMLQVALPAELRIRIARELFSKHVSTDEKAFAAELYCSAAELAEMQEAGMYIGSHGASHHFLNRVDEATKRTEIEESLEFLRGIRSPVDDFWVMCYPYGEWDESLLAVLRGYGCAAGLTIEGATADLDRNDPLILPRWDTNDFPKSASD